MMYERMARLPESILIGFNLKLALFKGFHAVSHAFQRDVVLLGNSFVLSLDPKPQESIRRSKCFM